MQYSLQLLAVDVNSDGSTPVRLFLSGDQAAFDAAATAVGSLQGAAQAAPALDAWIEKQHIAKT